MAGDPRRDCRPARLIFGGEAVPLAAVSDIEMYYEVCGAGPPLLITSGWAKAERAHAYHRDLFARHYTCIRHDHRGMGRSGSPPAPWTTETMGDDLAGLLDHLQLENVRVLGGGGMGGLVAAQLAIRHPSKVRSLFLGAGCAKADPFLAAVMGVWKDLYRLDRALWAREVTLWVLTPETFNTKPDLPATSARTRAAEDTFPAPGAFERTVDAYLSHDVTQTLRQIRCRTLVNCGGYEDLITGPRYARELWARIPGAELAIQENTSHANWVEKADEWGGLVLDWFART